MEKDLLNKSEFKIVCEAMQVSPGEIEHIVMLKKGMTNRSFTFECQGTKYIVRIPGAGTSRLINRRQETEVYQIIADKQICDKIIYINPENGYKITEFWENARVCNPQDDNDVRKCMNLLRNFHTMSLKVPHTFDIFEQINFYESLWDGVPSCYPDYQETKSLVLSLKSYIESFKNEKVLTHIDAVPDNFLFIQKENGRDEVRLIDWEYAGMQDPHVDLAMFCIYSLYDRPQVDRLIDFYFQGNCSSEIRMKIYCYISASGLLWSNWSEYKERSGVHFSEYSLRQYQYAKEYYQIVHQKLL